MAPRPPPLRAWTVAIGASVVLLTPPPPAAATAPDKTCKKPFCIVPIGPEAATCYQEHADKGKKTVCAESWSDDIHEDQEGIIVMTLIFEGVVLFILLVLIPVCGGLSLPLTLFFLLLVAVIIGSISAWEVTYNKSQKEIQSKTSELLLASGQYVAGLL
eukprot:gene56379-40429_t